MAEKIDILLQIRSDLAGLKRAQQETGKLSDLVKKGFGVGAGLGLTVGIGSLVNELKKAVGTGISFNAMVEQQTTAFRTLLGSVEAADERIKSLINFAATTPFQLGEVVEASKLLQALTGGALASEEGLKLVGDAAAAVGVPFKDAAFWIGRLYSGLEGGAPIGEAATRLQEMGLITSSVRAELNDLSGTAQGTNEAIRLMGNIFGKTSGAMELQAQTLNGRISTLKDGIDQLLGSLTKGVTSDLSEIVNLLNILLGGSATAADQARGKIIAIGAELRKLEESATSEQIAGFMTRLTDETQTATATIEELESQIQRLATEEAAQRQIVGANTGEGAGAVYDSKAVEDLGRIQKEQEILNAQLEEQKRLLAEIENIRQRASTDEAVARQARNSKDLAALNAEKARNEAIASATKEATKDNEKLSESVAKLYAQLDLANQSDEERLQIINQTLAVIEAQTNAEFEKADIITDAAQKRAVLDNIELKAEQKRIPLLLEQIKLEEKVGKAKTESSAAGVKLQASQLERQLDQIEHLKEIATLEGNTATSRKEVRQLVEAEKGILGDLIKLWEDYGATVQDPATREAIAGRLQNLEQRRDRSEVSGEPTSLLQQSTDRFDALSDPSQSFQDITSAATAALLDYQSQVGTISDQLHQQLMVIQGDLSGGIAESIEGLIRGTMDWSDAFENVGETIVNSVIQSFAQMLANWITTRLTMLALDKVFSNSVAASAGLQAASLAAAWAPAATAASIATLGGAAGVGTAAFISGLTIGTSAATAISGASAGIGASFAEGGYTGSGGKYDYAGTVHAGEFVMPSDVVNRKGPGFFYDMLDGIRSGNTGTSSGSGAGTMIVVDSRRSAQRYLESTEGEARIVDIMELNKGRLL